MFNLLILGNWILVLYGGFRKIAALHHGVEISKNVDDAAIWTVKVTCGLSYS